LGALYFLLFAVFDCCDGMQARLKKNGSEFGRFIDGLVDYTVNIFVYFALGFGTYKYSGSIGIFPIWILIILAGISKAIHSITFDHFLMEYLAYKSGDAGFLKRELSEVTEKLKLAKANPNESKWRLFALNTYYGFSKLQSTDQDVVKKFDPKDYVIQNHHSISLWGLIGPAWHILFLIIAFLFDSPSILFIYAILFGNLWLVLMHFVQKKINRRTKLV
jgi:hypothetical protein